MELFYSQRLFAFVFSAVLVLTLGAPTQAAKRGYVARGTAHFTGLTTFAGTGVATHLATYTEEGTVQLTDTADPTVSHVEASSIYTGSNGDQLFATISGELNGVTGAINATVTYNGGTGRFANATGTATLTGQLVDGTITVVVKGNIDY